MEQRKRLLNLKLPQSRQALRLLRRTDTAHDQLCRRAQTVVRRLYNVD